MMKVTSRLLVVPAGYKAQTGTKGCLSDLFAVQVAVLAAPDATGVVSINICQGVFITSSVSRSLPLVITDDSTFGSPINSTTTTIASTSLSSARKTYHLLSSFSDKPSLFLPVSCKGQPSGGHAFSNACGFVGAVNYPLVAIVLDGATSSALVKLTFSGVTFKVSALLWHECLTECEPTAERQQPIQFSVPIWRTPSLGKSVLQL